MIVLFEENETKFTSLGLGVLSDPISCLVTEGLNDNFELQLVYPVIGANYSKIKINRLLFTKPNPYEEPQPFRIISITKPINGKVTVDAVHISYDTNGLIVKPIKAGNLSDAVEKIQNGAILEHEFKIYTDMTGTKTFTTNNYYNLRALLMGSDSSLMNVYNCELSFDKFKIYLNKQRGTYRGAQVRYAKNMKDLSHVISYEKLYNGVYPFYHQETTETTTNTTSDGFKKVYIVGTKPFQDGWLSYTDGGEPYHPIDESPVQIGSDGDYKDKVYCWNTNLQRYQQKKYNEMFTVMEGVLSPEWIYIDWNSLLTTGKITCKAKVDGYFKMMTEEDWTFRKADEIIFQGSFKNIAEQLIIYYSEVIPGESTSEVTETESVTHVELDDQIIWLDTDGAKDMKHNRILSLDLTSEFEDVPDKDALEAKAKEYIEKNKIGKYKYETRVSFVDLSKTKEGVQYEGFEKILLGDIVKVVYEDMGVDVELRVTSVKYDVLKDAYDSVDLGEKPEKMSSSSVQNGDDISALTNDVGYADITTVNKLVAKIVTADFIKAKDAELSKAQIEMLETARIKCSGIIEASQFELDTLIAKLLIADNAQIKETLEAGTIKVNGDITISKGSINIKDDEKGTVFNVDREGNVRANSVSITGGTLNINDGVFEVERDGTMHATGAIISGQIDAQSGSIAGFNIVEDALYNGINSMEDSGGNGVYISPDGIRLGRTFVVNKDGSLIASTVDLTGKITATSGYIGNGSNGFTITNTAIYNSLESMEDSEHNGIYISTTGIRLKGSSGEFKVNSVGKLTATAAELTGKITAKEGFIGDFEITANGLALKDSQNPDINIVEITPSILKYGSNFKVDANGNTELLSATIGTDADVNIRLNIKDIVYAEYSSSKTYNVGDRCLYESVKYKCITPVEEPEEFNPNKWQSISTTEKIAYIASNGRTSPETGWVSSSGFYLGNDGLAIGRNFNVNADGELTASSVNITNGIIDIRGSSWVSTDPLFSVNSNGELSAQGANIKGTITITSGSIEIISSTDATKYFEVTPNGKLTATDAEIIGDITAKTGSIGGFDIKTDRLSSGTPGTANSVMMSPDSAIYTIANQTQSGWAFTAGTAFGVTKDGNVYLQNVYARGGKIELSSGKEWSNSAELIGTRLLLSAGSISNYPATSYDVTGISCTVRSGTTTPYSISVSNGGYYGAGLSLSPGDEARLHNGYSVLRLKDKNASFYDSEKEAWYAAVMLQLSNFGTSHQAKIGYGTITTLSSTNHVVTETYETGLSYIYGAVACYHDTTNGDGYTNRAIAVTWSSGTITVRWNVHDSGCKSISLIYIGY